MKDGKFLILCVDDDPDILQSLQVVLEANGYLFVSAPTAAAAAKVYETSKPDLMIIDLMMEEVDAGTRFVQQVRAAGSQVPIYLLSAVGAALENNIDAAGLGLDGTFQKPVAPRELLDTLAAKLRK